MFFCIFCIFFVFGLFCLFQVQLVMFLCIFCNSPCFFLYVLQFAMFLLYFFVFGLFVFVETLHATAAGYFSDANHHVFFCIFFVFVFWWTHCFLFTSFCFFCGGIVCYSCRAYFRCRFLLAVIFSITLIRNDTWIMFLVKCYNLFWHCVHIPPCLGQRTILF